MSRFCNIGPVRNIFIFCLLLLIKALCRVFYRFDFAWVGEVPPEPWRNLRLAALLNHTSLFEVIFFGALPVHVLWQLASQGVAPIADKTSSRPVAGRIFRTLAHRVVPISRSRDHTWAQLLDEIGPNSMVLLAPEGRMMRRNGRDSEGKPMSIKGGIADVLETMPAGRFLIGYSGGLHHVQAPGEGFPRLFETVRLRTETLDIGRYRAEHQASPLGFRASVLQDLERRKALYCPPSPALPSPAPAPPAAAP
jgi:hypothetical protein